MNNNMQTISNEDVEKILTTMPKFERDARSDIAFMDKLAELANSRETKKQNWNIFKLFRSYSLAGSLAAILLLISVAYISYQPAVTRGSILYPIKQTIENAQLALAFSPAQKIDTHLNFSDRRLEEANAIISHSSLLNWLVPGALASDNAVNLDTEEENNLSSTLSDMHAEVTKASSIVENSLVDGDASTALEKIANAADRHIEVLRKFNKNPAQKIDIVLSKIIADEDSHLSAVVEAHETIQQEIAENLAPVKIRLSVIEQNLDERQTSAQAELSKMLDMFSQLNQENQLLLGQKVNTAQAAFAAGKFGRSQGLSKALLNRMPTVSIKIDIGGTKQEKSQKNQKDKKK